MADGSGSRQHNTALGDWSRSHGLTISYQYTSFNPSLLSANPHPPPPVYSYGKPSYCHSCKFKNFAIGVVRAQKIMFQPVVAQADPLPSPSFLPNDISSTPPIDFSQPLSSLLKTSTARAHTNVENSAGARALISGLLPRDEYIKYLFMLWHVYE